MEQKSTEPFADEYYSLNMEKALEEAGFKVGRSHNILREDNVFIFGLAFIHAAAATTFDQM